MIEFIVPGQPQGKGRPRIGKVGQHARVLSSMRKASDAQVAEAFETAGSCRGAAALLGMCQQSVHERLVRLGLNRPVRIFTDAERSLLIAEYENYANAGRLADLAVRLCRTKTALCREAKRMGLTDRTRGRAYLAESSALKMKDWYAQNEHPRGMAGKTHSKETKEAIAGASRQWWAGMTAEERSAFTLSQLKAKEAKSGLARPRPEASWKAGWRDVGGRRIYFRSRWEANYGRYLEWLRAGGHIATWEHEPVTFWFEKIRRGTRSYLPDFRVTENDARVVYHEVKGWMDDRSKTKLNRMRIYHPNVALVVIQQRQYDEIRRKVSSLIAGWE